MVLLEETHSHRHLTRGRLARLADRRHESPLEQDVLDRTVLQLRPLREGEGGRRRSEQDGDQDRWRDAAHGH
jgi:hypothetical protein